MYIPVKKEKSHIEQVSRLPRNLINMTNVRTIRNGLSFILSFVLLLLLHPPPTHATTATTSSIRALDDVATALTNATGSTFLHANALLTDYSDVLHAISLPFGLITSFFGNILVTPVLFTSAFLTGSAFIYVSLSALLSDLSADTTLWIATICALFGGAMLGFFATRLLPLGMFGIGAAFGVLLTSVFKNSQLLIRLYPADPKVAFYGTACVLGLLFGLLAMQIQTQMLMFSTAYLGGGLFSYGLGGFVGHFPDRGALEGVKRGDMEGWTLLYAGVMMGIGTLGWLFQMWLARDRRMVSYERVGRGGRGGRRRRVVEVADWSDENEWLDEDYVERVPLPRRARRARRTRRSSRGNGEWWKRDVESVESVENVENVVSEVVRDDMRENDENDVIVKEKAIEDWTVGQLHDGGDKVDDVDRVVSMENGVQLNGVKV